MSEKIQLSETATLDQSWRGLLTIGGLAAFLTFLYIPLQIVIFMTIPEPTDALGWFSLFQKSSIQGLLSFEFLFIVTTLIGITTTLALYIVLKNVNETMMAIALVSSIIGVVCIIIARPAIDMLYLADHYAAATTEAQRLIYQTAGETLISMRHGSAFHVCYNLANINLIIIPLVMLRSKFFSKTTAYMGMVAGVLGFGLYIPVVGVWISVLSVLFMGVWDVLVGFRLIKLSRSRR